MLGSRWRTSMTVHEKESCCEVERISKAEECIVQQKEVLSPSTKPAAGDAVSKSSPREQNQIVKKSTNNQLAVNELSVSLSSICCNDTTTRTSNTKKMKEQDDGKISWTQKDNPAGPNDLTSTTPCLGTKEHTSLATEEKSVVVTKENEDTLMLDSNAAESNRF